MIGPLLASLWSLIAGLPQRDASASVAPSGKRRSR